MIKALFDSQIFNEQKFGGISRYYSEIFDELKNHNEIEVICPIHYTENIHLKDSVFFEKSFHSKNSILIKYSKIFRPYLPRKLKRKNEERTIELLKKQDFDLFIPTYYDPYFLAYLREKPFVLTIHDMIHELYPQYFLNDPFTIYNKKILIEKASRIIAVSENTKKDILRIYPNIDSKKIDVIYLAHQNKKEKELDIELPEKYILFVGKRTLYKNFDFFIKAAAPLIKENDKLFILCAGDHPFDDIELRLINELGINGRVLHMNFRDAELVNYYRRALCFVFPSEYEGFGIPILESMAYGCPILLTNNSSFPEIAGYAGIYFELNNATDLRDKLSSLMSNDEMRHHYKQKGIKQASKFTWQKTATDTLKAYHKALT